MSKNESKGKITCGKVELFRYRTASSSRCKVGQGQLFPVRRLGLIVSVEIKEKSELPFRGLGIWNELFWRLKLVVDKLTPTGWVDVWRTPRDELIILICPSVESDLE